MKKSVAKRNKRATISFTADEKKKLHTRFKATGIKHFSAFLRKLIFQQRVNVRYRNVSLDDLLQEITCFERVLSAVRSDLYAQLEKVEKAPYPFRLFARSKVIEQLHHDLIAKMTAAQNTLNRLPDKWNRQLPATGNFWDREL